MYAVCMYVCMHVYVRKYIHSRICQRIYDVGVYDHDNEKSWNRMEYNWDTVGISWVCHGYIFAIVTCSKGSTINTNPQIIVQYSYYSWVLHVFHEFSMFFIEIGKLHTTFKEKTGRSPRHGPDHWGRIIRSCSPWPCRNSPILPQGSIVPQSPFVFWWIAGKKNMANVEEWGLPPGSVIGRAILVCEERPQGVCSAGDFHPKTTGVFLFHALKRKAATQRSNRNPFYVTRKHPRLN